MGATPKSVMYNRQYFYLSVPVLAEVFRAQPASFDDAFQRADGDGFVAVHGDDDLAATRMTPLLMAAFLANHRKAVLAENSNGFFGAANRKAIIHVSATSNTLAPAGIEAGEGSNHSSSASLALRTASSSVSPADAQPGNSGKKADQRLVFGSSSMTRRSFIVARIVRRRLAGKARCSALLTASHSEVSTWGCAGTVAVIAILKSLWRE